MPSWMTLWLPACLGGAPNACEAVLLSGGRGDAYAGFFRMANGPRNGTAIFWSLRDGPPMGAGFFAAVRSEYGDERTARIWRADKPLPQAFRETTGESLGAFLQRRSVEYYGTRYHIGPWLESGSLFMALSIIAALLGATLTWARRPQLA